MKRLKIVASLGAFLSALFVFVGSVHATDIGGTISTTLIITEDSQLVDDVTCVVVGAPCIQFGAPGIKLSLNGFTITGPADPLTPTTGCTSTAVFAPEDGIRTNGQPNVSVMGPGLVQKFRRFGIYLSSGTIGGRVKGVTVSDNCFSGIQVSGTTNSDIEENVSVRNSSAPAGAPGASCGGT